MFFINFPGFLDCFLQLQIAFDCSRESNLLIILKLKIMKTKTEKQFEELKQFMSVAVNVEHWNELREKAKEMYPIKIIYMLDASGFINKI
jgi:hypothetical protein